MSLIVYSMSSVHMMNLIKVAIVFHITDASMSFFTELHAMQTRSSDGNSVRMSVCLSDTRLHCDKTKERSVQIFIPYERTFILVF